jgi:hypothetical protein
MPTAGGTDLMPLKQCKAGMFGVAAAIVAALVIPCAASAQDRTASAQPEPGILDQVGGWFGRQAQGVQSVFEGAGKQVENFGHEAGLAAEHTASGAKSAADTVATIPNTRMVGGHQECRIAPNGAPDCAAAAEALCRANGFKSGTSLAMTAAVKCPAEVYLAGRSDGPQCTDVTFVSQALCR